MTYIVKAPCDEAVIQAAPVHVSKELKRTMQAEQPTYQSQVGTMTLRDLYKKHHWQVADVLPDPTAVR